MTGFVTTVKQVYISLVIFVLYFIVLCVAKPQVYFYCLYHHLNFVHMDLYILSVSSLATFQLVTILKWLFMQGLYLHVCLLC